MALALAGIFLFILPLVALCANILQPNKFNNHEKEDETIVIYLQISEVLTDWHNPSIQQGLAIPRDVRRVSYLVNSSYPAPLLEFNLYDHVQIVVMNELPWEEITIHWHGLHQSNYNTMDGVNGITQCGIPPLGKYVYDFVIENAGTFWYHTHVAFQYEMGIAGPLIVQDPLDPYLDRYDDERVIALADWLWNPMQSFSVGLLASRTEDLNPLHILINGQWGNDTDAYPYPRINVTQGLCYRFRFINMGGETAGFAVNITGHNMSLIAFDGQLVAEVDDIGQFVFLNGERVDALICMDNPIGDYFINVNSADVANGQLIPPYHAFAILHYEGASDLNPNPPATSPSQFSLANGYDLLTAVSLEGPVLEEPPESEWLYLEFGLLPGGAQFYYGLEGEFIAFSEPAEPLIFSKGRCGTNDANIIDIPNEGTMQWIITNKVTPVLGAHPIHIHGIHFQVVGFGPGRFNSSNSIEPRNAVLKDIIDIPGNSFVVLRINVSNPGFWYSHCHIGHHHITGLAVVYNFLESKQTRPSLTLPRCGVCYQLEDSFWNESPSNSNDNNVNVTAIITGIVSAVISGAIGVAGGAYYMKKRNGETYSVIS